MRAPRTAAAALAAAAALVAPGAASADGVRLGIPQDDGSLTPYTFERAYPLVTLVYDTLTWRDADGVPRPWLARSVERDGTRVTIRLREGVRWHDGRPLTAEDVAFTFEFVRSRFHPRFTPQLRDVARVEAVDPLTVVVTLSRPSLGFADQPLADVPVLPRHLWEGLPRGRLAPAGRAVGSGPYRLVRHRRGRGYLFERNPGYFAGLPRPATIDVRVVRGPLGALREGELDMSPGALSRPGIRTVEGPSYLGTVLLLNVRRPPFDRVEVRRAVASALDLPAIARAAGGADPATSGYLHPDSRWSLDETLHRFDPGAARAGLAEVPRIELLAPEDDPAKRGAAGEVVRALGRGRVRELPAGELFRAVRSGRFEAAIWSSPALASYDPAFLTAVFGADGPVNYSGYRSDAFEASALGVSAAGSEDERREAVTAELRQLAVDAPEIPLFFPRLSFSYRPEAYDGWVFVKGSGILDKRSFLPTEAVKGGGADRGGDSGGIGVLGVAAIVLGALALLAAGWAVLRRRAA